MDKNTSELSPRYYRAEIAVWILGAVLFLHKLLDISLDQPLPFIDIKLQNLAYFPHIISAILFVVLLYLLLEFKQSQEKAKDSLLTHVRVAITTLWAIIAFWLIHPELVKNTVYEGVSPVWYLAFLGIGILLGFFAQILTFSTLMIRDSHEANTLKFPRIPNATRAQYVIWLPVVFLLLGCYFTLHFFAPDPIVHVATVFTALAFLYMVFSEFVFLFTSRDEDGNRVAYKERIAGFRELHSFHDRSYDLIDIVKNTTDDIGISSSDQPIEIQNKLREHYAVNKETQTVDFHVQQLEEIQIQFNPKDGNPENLTLDAGGFKIRKSQGNKDSMRVLCKPSSPDLQDVELTIPIKKVEERVEKFMATESENTKLDIIKIISKAINQTVLETLQEATDAPLINAAMAGDMGSIKELIGEGHDVNARGEGGWTALLASSAQGNTEIMKVLLDAGANPDISNVLRITSLIFGSRYGNVKVCKILIDYGADLNLQDMHGCTALMFATNIGNIEIVKILIQAGADLSAKNRDNKNALNLAYESGQGKIAKVLRKAENKANSADAKKPPG